jgi:hypothetical protein
MNPVARLDEIINQRVGVGRFADVQAAVFAGCER